MKKALLGSTAFLGAAVMFAGPAAADWETTISGFLKAEGWVADQDVEGTKPRGYTFGNDDFELQVKAKNTSDNGLTYGVTFEFENDFSADEAYLYIGGDWGQVTLGAQDGATDAMPYSGDFSLVATGGYDGGLSAAYGFTSGGVTTPDLAADTGDSAKIIYRSPRFSGFQLAANYAPDSDQGAGTDTETSVDTADEDDDDVFQIGANFVDTINGIDIGIGGAYSISSPMDTAAGGVSSTREDTEGVHVGFNVGYSGFTFGASYGDNFDSGCPSATAGCDGGQFYDVAGGYSTGPFAVGVGYFHSEQDFTSTTDADIDIISVTGQYSLAPGLALYGEFNSVDEEATGGTDNDGTIWMLGVSASF